MLLKYFPVTFPNSPHLRCFLFANFCWVTCIVQHTAAGAAGDLDGSFGIDGKVSPHFESLYNGASSLIVQDDGKILVGGPISEGDVLRVGAARFLTDGSLDPAFGTNGTITTPLDIASRGSARLVLQQDGKMVVVGSAIKNLWMDFALQRYDAAGALDAGFGSGGTAVATITSKSDQANTVVVQNDSKIVVGGTAWTGTAEGFGVARYLATGVLDTTFGSSGKRVTKVGDIGFDSSLALQSDGKIVQAGISTTGNLSSFTLLRYNTNGSLDAGFGSGGKVITSFGGSSGVGGLAMQSDGKIVAAGTFWDGKLYNFALARYNENGSLDGSFGNGGQLTFNFFGETSNGSGLAIQSDGKIVVAGQCGGQGNERFALARLDPDGGLDDLFGVAGRIRYGSGSNRALGSGVGLQNDGKILMAGKMFTGEYSTDFLLMRFQGEGPPVCTPVVVTHPAEDIKSTAVTLSALVNADETPQDGTGTAVSFEYAALDEMVYRSMPAQPAMVNGSLDTTVRSQLTGLIPNTIYRFRAHGLSGGNAVVGTELEFRTASAKNYDAWRKLWFNSYESTGVYAAHSDFDNDGLMNVLEWACGTNPVLSNRPPYRMSFNRETGLLGFTYPKGIFASGEVTYQVEWSADLSEPWSTTGVSSPTSAPVDPFWEDTVTLPAGTGGHRFVRLRVSFIP